MLYVFLEELKKDYVPYLLWHVSRPHYKQMEIWGVSVYVINVIVTREKFYNISNNIND